MAACWREEASWIYDVFLSFSGIDTRMKFTAQLLDALERHHFYTFRDDTKLKRGEEIGPGLLSAIEKSKLSIVIFSKNYASSRWCLDELVKIMDCKRKLKQVVLPIFYHLQPSDVRSQRGSYAEAFATHQNRFKMESVESWRATLTDAANLSGYVLPDDMADEYETKLIEKVVGDVADKLNPTCLSVADYPVGIEGRVQQLSEFLKLGSNSDVRIVTIWGMGGIGKTTIAKAMYNRIHRMFESSSFLVDVRRTSLVQLQENLLRDLLKDRDLPTIRSEAHGIEEIKRRARCGRVLIVLDDVDNICQLRALAINRDLFCSGSRIIVTTRDLSSVSMLQVDEVYELHALNEKESLQLFSWHAFREDHPLKDYDNLSKEVVIYARGLPLVLEILGSLLSKKTIAQWTSQLKKLKKIPHHDVQSKLRLSYDSLNVEQKDLFLDIACFFVGMDQDLSIKILEGCDFFSEIEIGVLSGLCLVRIDGHNRVVMHDLIQDMGRYIVHQESPREPGKRSRLWYHEDILDVVTNNTGTEHIQGIVLNLSESDELQQVNAKAFREMKMLRLLHLNYVHLSGSCKHLSRRLVWLSWKGFSLNCMPSALIMDNMVAIDLSYSKLRQVWRGSKNLSKLKYLNLSHSYFLAKTPDFTGLTSLEILLLNDCTKLVDIHQSIGCLKNLVVLDMKNCHNLVKLPLSIFMLKPLLYFNISGCSKLEWPAFFKGSPAKSRLWSLQISSSIRKLYMEDCNITYVPSEIGRLVSLQFLNLSRNNFSNLPDTITSLSQLKAIYLNQCIQLQSLPALPSNLLGLSAHYCTSLESISIESKAAEAPFMTFYGCSKLVHNNFAYNFRRNLLGCQGLEEQGEFNIFLPGSEVPRWCNYQSEGHFLCFRVPEDQLVDRKIQGLILCVIFCGRRREDDDKFAISYSISNLSKRSWGYSCQPRVDFYPIRCEDQMWLTYIPNRILESKLKRENNQLEGGNKVEISIQIDYIWQVKKCGVSLVYEGDEDEKDRPLESNDEGMIEYMEPPEEGNSITIASDFHPGETDVSMRWIPTDQKFLEEIGKL